jgi:arabinogalactan oligomer/maltooligosaccharide transport system substrate-binding protein
MSKKMFVVISILLISTFVISACGPKAPKVPTGAVKLTLWTKEGEADGGFQFVKGLTDAFTVKYPNITFEVINKEVETLREDFQTASLAGAAPDLLWTVNDHAGPFTTAGIIQPVGDFFDMKKYVPSVEMDKKVWAVPISSGNHLMLLYNKDLVKTPPATTDDFVKVAKELTKGDVYGFVYNATEPFWLVPWLGGFGGKVFADDGVTPTLNTPEMVNTLQFLYNLKNTDKVTPA